MSPHRFASRAHSAVSLSLVLILAGAAWFVLPATVGATVPDTGAVTQPVEEIVEDTVPPTDGVTDPVEGIVEDIVPPTDGVTPPVEDIVPPTDGVTEPVEGIVEDTLPGSGGSTQPVSEIVEETLPGSGGTTDPIEDLTGSLEETVRTVEGTLNEVTGPVVDSVDETVTGSSVDSPDRTDGQKQSTYVRGGSLAGRFPHEFSGVGSSASNPERVFRIAPASAPAPSGPGLIEQITKAALDAAKKVAFPLALALIAGAFVILQGRIDRRDPKLAAAPIEIDEQLLRFE